MKAISIDKIAILKRKRIVFGVTADLMNSSKSGAVVSNLLKSDQIGDYSRWADSMGFKFLLAFFKIASEEVGSNFSKR